MSAVKKYFNNEWQKFGETNKEYTAAGISAESVYTSQVSSVQDVLNQQQYDIDKLKRNVSWLALHGGGGAGSGGGGGGSGAKYVTADVTVNSHSSGSKIAINDSASTKLQIQLENITPVSQSKKSWQLTITIAGKTIRTPEQSIYDPKSAQGFSIDYSEFSQYINKTDQNFVNIVGTLIDPAGEATGDCKWSGYVYIPQISITPYATQTFVRDNIANPVTPTSKNWYAVHVTTTTYDDYVISSYGSLGLYVTSADIDNFTISAGHTTEIISVQLSNLFDKTLTADIQSGTYTVRSALSSKTGQVKDTTYSLTMIKNGLTPVMTGISQLSSQPTEIDLVLKAIKFDFTTYHPTKTTLYSYEIGIVDDQGRLSTLVEASSQQLNRTYTIQTYAPSNFVKDHVYTLVATAHRGDENESISAYVKLVEKEPMISIPSLTAANMLVDFNWQSERFTENPNFQDIMQLSSACSSHTYTSALSVMTFNSASGMKMVDQTGNNNQGALCFKNQCYGMMNPVFSLTDGSGSYSLANLSSWVIELTFKTGKYGDDDHVVFAYGEPDVATGIFNNGIAVKTHGIHINQTSESLNKYVELQDNTTTVVHLVYRNGDGTIESGTQKWPTHSQSTSTTTTVSYFKIYVDGVLTYATDKCPFKTTDNEVQINNCKFYIAAANNQQFCDTELYDFKVFTTDDTLDTSIPRRKYLTELELLGTYMNAAFVSHYTKQGVSTALKRQLLNRNFSFQVGAESSLSNQLSSSIIRDDGTLNFNNVIFQLSGTNTYTFPLTQDQLTSMTELYTYITDEKLVLPMVFIDMHNSNNAWSFEDFRSIDKSSYDPVESTTLYYMDPSAPSIKYGVQAQGVKVAIQGTSTKTDFIKNIDVTMHREEDQGTGYIVEDLLHVRSNWVPEHTYTLKADVVDSSHCNNASIGKFINDTFADSYAYSDTFGFGFDTLASQNFNITKQLFTNANLKHTVEGFPVLLFIHFKGEEEKPRLLGIYSFNIGRAAVRNLGFVNVSEIKNAAGTQSLSASDFATYPHVFSGHQVKENATANTYWIEAKSSINLKDEEIPKLSSTAEKTDITDLNLNTQRMLFWQNDATVLNSRFEVRYPPEDQNPPLPSQIAILSDAVQEVAVLPIEGMATTNMNEKVAGYSGTYFYGSYKNWKIDGQSDIQLTSTTTMSIANVRPITKINLTQAQCYFVLAMLFGLRDNFEKNISYRVFNTNSATAKFTVDFYDLDTALGITNVGAQDVSPVVWFKKFFNILVNSQYYAFGETYTNNSSAGISAITNDAGKTIDLEANWNKLWLTIDSPFYNTDSALNNNGGYSEYSKKWFSLRQVCETTALAVSQSQDFVEYFMQYYFEAQTAKCGNVIFNHDYNMKYLNVFYALTPDAINCSVQTTISKLHGRRVEYTRRWLTERINFLDSYFYWRNKSHYIDDDNVPSLLGSFSSEKIKTNLTGYAMFVSKSGQVVNVKTDKPTLLKSKTSTGGVTSFALCLKNAKTPIYAKLDAEQNYYIYNIANVYYWDIGNLTPSQIASGTPGQFSNIQELYFNSTSFAKDGFQLTYFGTVEKPSQLTSLTMTNIKDGYPVELDVSNSRVFPRLVNINVNGSSQITKLELSKNVPLQSLVINGTGINSLTLSAQDTVTIPAFDKCTNLNSIVIEDCTFKNRPAILPSDYADIYIKAQTQLKSLRIKNVETIRSLELDYCPQLTSVYLDNCKNLTSVKIVRCDQLNSYDSLTIIDNNKLSSIVLDEDLTLPTFRFRQTDLSNIVNLSLKSTSITHITRVDDNGNSVIATYDGSPMLDLHDFTSISSTDQIDTSYISDLSCIRFPNNPDKPVKVNCIFGQVNESGRRNNKLRRILGNIEVKSAQRFSNLSAFSIFGDSAPARWDQNDHIIIADSQSLWDISASYSAIFNEFQTNNQDATTVSANTGATNIQFVEDNETWSCAYSQFSGTNCTWFDVYYALYKIARYNQTAPAEKKIINITSLFTSQSSQLNQLPQTLFKGLGDIKTVYYMMVVNGGLTLTKQLMQQLSSVTSFTGMFSRVKDDARPYYAPIDVLDPINLSEKRTINTFNSMFNSNWRITAVDGQPMTYGRMLKHISGTTSIVDSFNPSKTTPIRISNDFDLPETLQTIQSSFSFDNAVGNVSLSAIFNKTFPALTSIYNSFNATKNASVSVFYHPSSFKNLSALVNFGDSYGSTAHSLHSIANKFIVTDDFVMNDYTRPSYEEAYTTSMWNDFTDNLLSCCPNLMRAIGVLEHAQIAHYSGVEELSFPNTLFNNLSSLMNISQFMKNFNGCYKLTSNGFRRCSKLNDVSQLFYQNIYEPISNDIVNSQSYQYGLRNAVVVPTYDSKNNYFLFERLNYGISSDIPYKFFFTGMSSKKTQIDGIVSSIVPPMSYSNVLQLLKNLPTTGRNVILSSSILSCGITEVSYTALSADKHEIFDQLSEQFPIYDLAAVHEYQLSCPLSSSEGIKEGCETLVSTLTATYEALKDVNAWYNDILSVQTVLSDDYNKPTYNKPIQTMTQCFYGNGRIRAYVGATHTEVNEDYRPFKYVLDKTTNTWTTIDEVDPYLSDDSWSYNGEIVNTQGQPTIDLTHKNNCTLSTYPLNDITNTKGAYALLHDYNSGQGVKKFNSYVRLSADNNTLNYICSPDLLRYSRSNCNVNGLFQNCGLNGWKDYYSPTGTWSSDMTDKWGALSTKINISAGIRGRIPSNLLQPISEVTSIANIFQNCKQITGYKEVTLSSDGLTQISTTYLIPPTFFKNLKVVRNLEEAFYGMYIPFSTNLNIPFSSQYLDNRDATTDYNLIGIFANCCWAGDENYSETSAEYVYKGIFDNKYCSNIGAAFSLSKWYSIYDAVHTTEADYPRHCKFGNNVIDNVDNNLYTAIVAKTTTEGGVTYGCSVKINNMFTLNTSGLRLVKTYTNANNCMYYQYICGTYAGWTNYVESGREYSDVQLSGTFNRGGSSTKSGSFYYNTNYTTTS